MATYKGIKGFTIQSLASDPVALAAWSSGGALNTGRNNTGGVGTATAAAVAGGADDPAGYTNKTEEYNGTAWTEVTNYPASRTYIGTAGSQTAGLFCGGASPPSSACFLYDGTSFSATGSGAMILKQGACCGLSTAALYCGGEIPAVTTQSEEFNGSTWSSGGAMSQARNNNTSFGIQTDAVTVGGAASPGAQYNAETYNGTAWTVGNALNTGRQQMAAPGAGTASTAGMVAGGTPTPTGTVVENYNGTIFSTNSTTLTTGRAGASGTRSPTSSYLVTGGTPGYKTTTEVYSENSEPNTFLVEGEVWYNTTSNVLKGYNGTTIKTFTAS